MVPNEGSTSEVVNGHGSWGPWAPTLFKRSTKHPEDAPGGPLGAAEDGRGVVLWHQPQLHHLRRGGVEGAGAEGAYGSQLQGGRLRGAGQREGHPRDGQQARTAGGGLQGVYRGSGKGPDPLRAGGRAAPRARLLSHAIPIGPNRVGNGLLIHTMVAVGLSGWAGGDHKSKIEGLYGRYRGGL
eukprot:1177636-Prorocentrum_minimum.AAC.2